MARIPKHDVPSLAYFFLLLCIAGLVLLGVFAGILASADVFRSVGRFFSELLWVLV